MKTLTLPAALFGQLLQLARRSGWRCRNPFEYGQTDLYTFADALELALDDLPEQAAPPHWEMAPPDFFAGERRVVVLDFIELFRRVAGLHVELSVDGAGEIISILHITEHSSWRVKNLLKDCMLKLRRTLKTFWSAARQPSSSSSGSSTS